MEIKVKREKIGETSWIKRILNCPWDAGGYSWN